MYFKISSHFVQASKCQSVLTSMFLPYKKYLAASEVQKYTHITGLILGLHPAN